MARELPIHNGRMTTDLDANGFKIKNLPPGSGFTQAQADWSQTDATAPDFIKNKPTIPVMPTLATVATSGSYNDLSNKPTIPAAVTVDATLTQQGAAADAEAVGNALRGGFTEWEFSDVPSGLAIKNVWYATSTPYGARWAVSFYGSFVTWMADQDSQDATELTFLHYVSEPSTMTATRHLVTPTKTSQLHNDGDGTNAFVKTNDSRLKNARTPTAHHATHAAGGSDPLAPADIGAAAASDLPYALVEPGEWEFSGLPSGATNITFVWDSSRMAWQLEFTIGGSVYTMEGAGIGGDSALNVTCEDENYTVTATRASLPGHLCDRAGNRVEVSGDTTLTLPAANPGYLRDFLVRLEISGSTVPTITFAAPTGETIVYETDGDEFPVPDEAGTWLYAFTETDDGVFGVSLKKVNVVAQGGGT